MIRLNNDYCHGAIPEILEALQTTNSEAYAGYELDEWCERSLRRRLHAPMPRCTTS